MSVNMKRVNKDFFIVPKSTKRVKHEDAGELAQNLRKSVQSISSPISTLIPVHLIDDLYIKYARRYWENLLGDITPVARNENRTWELFIIDFNGKLRLFSHNPDNYALYDMNGGSVADDWNNWVIGDMKSWKYIPFHFG
jgi:hypothetical protein